jgi:ATP-binding cassette subfamily B protein
VFDQGRVVEDGSHAELLARNGAYQRLWSRQAGGFVLGDGAGGEVERARDVEDNEAVDSVDPQETPEEVIGHDRNPKRRPLRER